ncbi:MAG: ACT domain-containing protein [Clostridiales bacterium]|jgi:hypothetical protein|nr:ACT domain-containing protein [Clostridiales bacterium]
MKLTVLREDFAICRLNDFDLADCHSRYVFFSKTDEEISLVCQSHHVPANALEIEDGWRALRVDGVLDLGAVGVIASITQTLAAMQVAVFVISTFQTDYILVKERQLQKAGVCLREAGFEVEDR